MRCVGVVKGLAHLSYRPPCWEFVEVNLGLLGTQLLSGSFSAPAAFPTDVRLFCSYMSGLAFFELILLS